MFRRMGGADASFLALETPRQYMHTFKITILDIGEYKDQWSFDEYRRRTEKRIHMIPAFRWRYVPSPLGLGYPLWVDDPDFNLDYHLRHVACPAPGDQKALCKFMSSIYAYQLDRARPLWISWVVEGLQDDKIAIVTLIHHAYLDGAGATNALKQIFSPGLNLEEDPDPPPWNPGPVPAWPRRFLAGVVALLRGLGGGMPRAVKAIIGSTQVRREFSEKDNAPRPDPKDMPFTPLNRIVGHGRTLVCDSMPFEKLQQARVTEGATINDVFLSCSAGALRRLMRDRHFDADKAGPLVAGIPVARKRPPGMELQGNFATVEYCWLHTDIEDPLERLRKTHDSANDMKAYIEASKDVEFGAVYEVMPLWLTRIVGWLVRRKEGRFGIFGNVILSNVPGPREPLYGGPFKVDNWFSTGQVFDGSSLNMTMWTYCGKANLCIFADSQVLPKGWDLYGYFCEELDTLIEHGKKGKKKPRKEPSK